MSFDLSFSPEFFFAEGEPYDGGPELPTKRPTSVWSAIESMRLLHPKRWGDMARHVFNCKPEHLAAESVLERIEQTNTCRSLNTPVEVYIDSEGIYSVEVY